MITSEMINRVLRLDSGGLPVVSLYVGVDQHPRSRGATRTRISSLLHEIRPMVEDRSVSREVRLSLRGDIERIEDRASEQPRPPGTVAMFSCSRAGLFEEFHLPRIVRDRIVANTTPWLRPMLTIVDEYHRTCVATVDQGWAQLWELYLGEFRKIGEIHDVALRQPAYAGWHGLLEYRLRNKSDTSTRRHYLRIASALNHLFQNEEYHLLVVGVHREDTSLFLESLPRALRSRVARTIDIAHNSRSLAEIRQATEAVLEDYKREEEHRLVSNVTDRVAIGMSALGMERCLWAGSVAAIQILLVQEGILVPGVICDESGWLAREGATCPLCGKPTRSTPDVIDELAQATIGTGGSVKHITSDTVLEQYAVGALLRFPLPPTP